MSELQIESPAASAPPVIRGSFERLSPQQREAVDWAVRIEIEKGWYDFPLTGMALIHHERDRLAGYIIEGNTSILDAFINPDLRQNYESESTTAHPTAYWGFPSD